MSFSNSSVESDISELSAVRSEQLRFFGRRQMVSHSDRFVNKYALISILKLQQNF